MPITVTGTDDAAAALSASREFLASRPAEHNLVLTLLAHRAAEPGDGRYWVASDDDRVVGVTFLSPLDFFATMTPATNDVVDAFVGAVAHDVPELVGVNGDASTTARFAGEWSARHHVRVVPEEAQRLYVLDAVHPPSGVPGDLRTAREDELGLLVEWADGFATFTGDGRRPADETRSALRALTDEGRLFVWEHDGPASMASLSPTVAGGTRVQRVYTPPERRRHGYASACVAAVSQHALGHDATTCVLYTQLSNPTSNAIYRAIGYEPIAEILRYRFG
jgi:uncharacterized protein